MAGEAATDHALERLVFFSDAVFAIAITLLVIEIHPPHLPHSASSGEHLRALAQLIPNFVGFATSFIVIGLFWIGHHRAFMLASHYQPRVVGWNLALLAAIAFMPFVTGYFSANYGARVPTFLYCAMMATAGLFNLKVNRIVTAPPMVSDHATADEIATIRARGASVALGAATAALVAAIFPLIGPAALFTIFIWRRLLARSPVAPSSAG